MKIDDVFNEIIFNFLIKKFCFESLHFSKTSRKMNNDRIFYQNAAPEFVVMERVIQSGIAYYMNNGHIEVRDKVDNHIIREEEMTQETINHLKRKFEENKKIHKQTELECERLREKHKRTVTDK